MLPSDPLSRGVEIYNELNKNKGFFGDSSSLRFVVISVVCCEGSASEVADERRVKSEEIKDLSGWFGELR